MSSYKVRLYLLAQHVLTKPLQLNLCSRDHRLLSLSVENCRQYENRFSGPKKTAKGNFDNPGVGNRLKIIKKDMPDIDSVEIFEEDIEDLEGDFLNARHMREHHIRDSIKLKQRDQLKMIERKYFKPAVEPNMLTWSDKVQIKHLYEEDPLIWNFDKLSESFPATPQIIKKVIKSSWKPESQDRIRKHDEVVVSNWKAFNEGRLNINCTYLKEHLKKFTKRVHLPITPEVAVSSFEELPKPELSEFCDIIQSYKSLNVNHENNIDVNEEKYSESDEHEQKTDQMNRGIKQIKNPALVKKDLKEDNQLNYKQSNSSSTYTNNKKNYTLENLRVEMKKKQSSTDLRYLNEQDRMFLKGESSGESFAVNKRLDSPENLTKNIVPAVQIDTDVEPLTLRSKAITNYKNTQSSNFLTTSVPKRIHIAKNKVKIGYLYKVKDCFYSHDGYFLYKVPGIVEENR